MMLYCQKSYLFFFSYCIFTFFLKINIISNLIILVQYNNRNRIFFFSNIRLENSTNLFLFYIRNDFSRKILLLDLNNNANKNIPFYYLFYIFISFCYNSRWNLNYSRNFFYNNFFSWLLKAYASFMSVFVLFQITFVKNSTFYFVLNNPF